MIVTWHCQYGHLGIRSLQLLARDNIWIMIAQKGLAFANPVQKGEPSVAISTTDSHTCKPYTVMCVGRLEVNPLLMTTDHTRCVWVYVMKKKSKVLQWFWEWKAEVERQAENPPHWQWRWVYFCLIQGIRHEVTIPHTPNKIKWYLMNIFEYGGIQECTPACHAKCVPKWLPWRHASITVQTIITHFSCFYSKCSCMDTVLN